MASAKALELAERVWGWKPHSDGQREWLLSEAPVKVAACGRRWGKSESTALDITLFAFERPNTIQILIAPTQEQTRIIMEEIERRLYSVPGLLTDFDHRRAPYAEMLFHDGHGLLVPTQILARTAGRTGRGLRGRKAHRVIVDESAYVSDRIMQQVVTPLLADYDGQRVEVSTPDGLNHFWEDFNRGQDTTQQRYQSFQFPTSANPYIPASYLANEKATKPEKAFAQEYLAQFLDQEGAVFRRVKTAIGPTLQPRAQNGRQYVAGVDWGRSGDFTVIVIIDVYTGDVVAIDRFNQIDFSLQLTRLKALHERFRCAAIVAEQNSIGMPQIEAMQRMCLPVRPFVTTNASKAEIIDGLSLAFEREEIGIPDDPVLYGELMAYQCEKLPSGLLRYGAPDGQHDDCVMALALAWYASRVPLGAAIAGPPRDLSGLGTTPGGWRPGM